MKLYNLLVKSIDFWQKQSGLSNLKTHTIYSKILDSDSLVIDLGANIGQFTEIGTWHVQCPYSIPLASPESNGTLTKV